MLFKILPPFPPLAACCMSCKPNSCQHIPSADAAKESAKFGQLHLVYFLNSFHRERCLWGDYSSNGYCNFVSHQMFRLAFLVDEESIIEHFPNKNRHFHCQ